MRSEALRIGTERELQLEKWRGGAHEWRTRLHYGVVCVESGVGTIDVGNRRLAFETGDVLLLTEGVGALIDMKDEARATAVFFSSYVISEELKERLLSASVVVRAAGLSRRLGELMMKISAEQRSPDALSGDVCRAHAIEIAAIAARALNELEEQAQTCPAVSTVLDYIREHSAERLSLSEMADICKVSTAYLSRKFKAEVGVGFADYVTSHRLGRAASMLRQSPEMSVTEIAFSCGFNDSNYFSDKFKRHFGISPLKFRKGE